MAGKNVNKDETHLEMTHIGHESRRPTQDRRKSAGHLLVPWPATTVLGMLPAKGFS